MSKALMGPLVEIYNEGRANCQQMVLDELLESKFIIRARVGQGFYTATEEGIDALVEEGLLKCWIKNFEDQPDILKILIDAHPSFLAGESDYDELKAIKMEFEKHGFTFDFWMDRSAFNLVRLPYGSTGFVASSNGGQS